MSAQGVKSLNTMVFGSQVKSLSHLLVIPAAALLLIAFFMPWLTVTRQGIALDDATGYEIASGIGDGVIEEGAGHAFDTAADPYAFVLPLLAIIAAGMAAISLVTRRVPVLVLAVYVLTGVLGLGIYFLKYVQIQIDLTDAQMRVQNMVTVRYEAGWWLGLAAAAVMLVAAYLFFRAEELFYEQPTVVRVTRNVRANGLQFGIVSVMLILWVAFIVGSPETFLSSQIYRALMTSIPYWGIVALPLTMVVIAGEIDLSFPSIMAIGMVAFFEVYTRIDNLGLAFAGALTAGFLVGLLNGVIIVRLGIPSLIATIGTQFFWRGVVEVIRAGQGESMTFTRDTALRNTLVSKVWDYFPAQMIWMLLVGIVVWIILNRHRFGAHVYLIGDNEDSARLMGVNVGLTRLMLFALVGLAAAFAGVIQSVDNWYFWPNLGEGYLMQTLAAVFLGGTSVFGGMGTVFGTFIACFIIGGIQPGIVAVGLTGYYTKLIYGLIITASVAMHTLMRKRMQ